MSPFLPRITFDPSRLPAILKWLGVLLSRFEGRCGRRDFWIGSAIMAATLLIIERVLMRNMPHYASIAMVVVAALAIFPFGALATKRGNDRGHGENWGMIIVLLSVAAGLVTKALGHGPWAFSASALSICIWLYTLVDLGMMPSVIEQQIPSREVGGWIKR